MLQRQILEDGVWYGFKNPESYYYFLTLLEKKGNVFPDVRYKPGLVVKRDGCSVSLIEGAGKPDAIWYEDPYTSMWKRIGEHNLSTFGSIGVSPTFAKLLERVKRKKIDDITIVGLKVIVSSHVSDDFAFCLYPSYEEKKENVEEALSRLNRELVDLKWEVKKLRSNEESNNKAVRFLNTRLEKIEEKKKTRVKWLTVAKDIVTSVFFVLGVIYVLELILY